MERFFLLLRAFGAGGAARTGAFALQSRPSSRGGDLLGDLIGFEFVGVAGLADAQLGLDGTGLEKVDYRLVAQGALKAEKGIERRQKGLETTGLRYGAGLLLGLWLNLLSFCFLAHGRPKVL